MFLFLSLRYRISIGFHASVMARSRYAACNVLFCARPPGCGAAPSPERRHIGLGPGLIDEDEALGIGAALIGAPLLAPALDVFAIRLLGGCGFFMAEPLSVQELPDQAAVDLTGNVRLFCYSQRKPK
jgi:hypothetical protein